jgi:outer membrane protein OmpA-like peptidoglycan-associated protein/tetratricopeptide (TPR) repeat protein
MKSIFTLLITTFSLAAFGQQYDPSRVHPKAAALYEEAIEKASNDQFQEGIQLLRKSIGIDPVFMDAYLSIAGMFSEMKNYDSSIAFYEKALTLDTLYFRHYNLTYSINLAGAGKFEQALKTVDKFLSISVLNEKSRQSGLQRKKNYEFALQDLAKHRNNSYQYAPKNLGDEVNSAHAEYFPSLTFDGKTLVFTRRLNGTNEDLFSSSANGKSAWSNATPLAGDLNTRMNEGASTISQDGQWLIFTGCNFPNSQGSCDLFLSVLGPQGWSAPQNLGNDINSEFWESAPSLSPDKQELYFASRRLEGFGGSDLFVARRLSNGRFGPPQNLGPTINTAADESTPFMHADNETLYFTSNGLPGYGGDDLFKTKKTGVNRWSLPENLGFPINTIEDEGSLVIAADGKTAYYAGNRADTKGSIDLYSFELREDVRPAVALQIKGTVYDRKTGKKLPSLVELSDLALNLPACKVETDESGNYRITLAGNKPYAFNVSRKGYLFYSQRVEMPAIKADTIPVIDIALQPLEPGASITLNNVLFESKSYNLLPESSSELDRVLQLLKENPALKIEVEGHTDNVGTETDNQKLSQARARAVLYYLSLKGIGLERMSSKGYGSTKPVADNKTEAGRSLNRRTELKVTSN